MKDDIPNEWNLTADQIRHIYEVETRLADKLRNASGKEREKLYANVYDEYYRLLPFHPHREPGPPTEDWLKWQIGMMRGLLHDFTVFLEIGAGDGSLSREVSKRVEKVYALDVSGELPSIENPENMERVTAAGIDIPLPENSVDVAFSNQLMEHLHPDDAMQQLKNILHVLKPGGVYLCTTPNRINGPHDISRFFDKTPRGFHLREYSGSELHEVFLKSGFTKAKVYLLFMGEYRPVPIYIIRAGEFICELFPARMIQQLLKFKIWQILINGTVIGKK